MNIRALAVAALLALAPAAWAQEQAFTNRSTDLRERGANDARALTTLAENTAVKVLARAGGWTRVEAGGQSGWVNVFHLRFPVSVESKAGGGGFFSGVTSVLGGGRQTDKTATLATTGIRGLSPEDLKNASPDTAALAKAQSYRADKPAAERFARDGKLVAVTVN